MEPSMPQCPQCGNYHPQVAQGQTCPLSSETTDSGENIDLTEFFTNLRNICISQIQSRKLKNHKKLFQAVIVNVAQMLEEYEE